ncbi:putative homeobox protein NANOG2 [Cavia porcellus]|uniref:putative homeobox protein NANOG2 n=1 Tax=Cavia porcellus TaxID=10141 RepID=UPI00022B5919
MSVAPDCPPSLSCSEAAGSGDPSPTPEVPRPAETCGALQPPEAEQPLAESGKETAPRSRAPEGRRTPRVPVCWLAPPCPGPAPGLRRRLSPPGGWKRRAGARVAVTEDAGPASPIPSSGDLPLQETPDSSTSPCATLPSSLEASDRKEGKGPPKKQKIRTVFSETQLYVLRDRFQRQQYLSLQQMQELSSLLNLSYKQVKTWFQNQRMKCKRWQKSTGLQNGAGAPEKVPAPAEYPGVCSNYAQSCLVNTSGNLPMWGNQTWNNSAWSSQTWGSQSWGNHSWNTQSWCPQTWNSPFPSCEEESLQPCLPFPQNFPASDLEAMLEVVGDSHKYFNTPQDLDLFLNYAGNLQPEDL